MAYSTKEEVKALLRIIDTSHDTEIDAAIGDADVRIDNMLKNHTSVPVSPTPDSVNRASKFLAAGLFRRLNPTSKSEAAEAEIWERTAMQFLNEYVLETYYSGKMRGG